MAEVAQTASVATWIQILVGGGLAGAVTSLISTRVELRRLKNEEAERSSFYEQQMFQARLDAYRSLSSALSTFTKVLNDHTGPARARGSWTPEEREAIGAATQEAHVDLSCELMNAALLFGPAMEGPLGEWTLAVNLVRGVYDDSASVPPPEEAFAICMSTHYGVLQAMRADLHLGRLDATLVKKLSKVK